MKNLLVTSCVAAAAACFVSLSAGAAAPPTISTIAPPHAPRDARVTISGTNLKGGRVTFGGHGGVRTTVNAAGTRIVTYVPPGIHLGQVIVKVTTQSGSVTAGRKFVVDAIP